MNKLKKIITILSSCMLPLFSADALQNNNFHPSIEELVNSNTTFAISLYNKIKIPEDNLIFSPYSISTILAISYLGASENTEKELKKALHLTMTKKDTNAMFKELNMALLTTLKNQLFIANGIVLSKYIEYLNNDFKSLLKKNYNADILHGNLADVNRWVKDKTNNKINHIYHTLPRNTILTLLNAIYFKGIWENTFNQKETINDTFFISKNKQVNIPIMHQKNHFKFYEYEDFKVIELPYVNKKISMFVFLPNNSTLNELEKKLDSKKLNKCVYDVQQSTAREVMLYLPKFKLSAEYDLNHIIKQLGINDAFQPSIANFTDMGMPKGEVWISSLKHKIKMTTNEEGSYSSSASSLTMSTRSIYKSFIFKVDHPFLFIIQDNKTKSILLMGRIKNPASS